MKKNLVAPIIIFIAGLALGLLISWWLPFNIKTLNRPGDNLAQPNIPGSELHKLQGQVSSVDGQNIKFEVKSLQGLVLAAAFKTARIEENTVLYLLTPKTAPETGDEYTRQIDKLRDDLRQAMAVKNTQRATALQTEIKSLSLAHNTAINQQADDLNIKIKALPVDSTERREAERAYLELISTFKYSIITLADIKSGDAIQVWSKDDLRDPSSASWRIGTSKDKFVATKVEIKR